MPSGECMVRKRRQAMASGWGQDVMGDSMRPTTLSKEGSHSATGQSVVGFDPGSHQVAPPRPQSLSTLTVT